MTEAHLRPYQDQAIDFLEATPRANLFAGMGLGKTLAVETLIAELQSPDPTLVIAPLRVARKVWSDEANEWDHLKGLRVATITGTPGERAAALKVPAHIHTINYENIEWLLEHIPATRWPFRTVVADESTRLKNFRTREGNKRRVRGAPIVTGVTAGGKRSGALATVATRANRWINLTGTPSANGLLDLWGQQWFVDFGEALGVTYSGFMDRWFYRAITGGAHARILPFAHSQGEIEERMRSTTMSINARDWFDIAEPIRTTVHVQLPALARREYKRMARELFAQIDNHLITAANAGVKSGKLLQLASGAVYKDDGKSWVLAHDQKIEALRSIVNEAAGMPVLVAYHYRHTLDRIVHEFPHARVLRHRRDEDDWNAGKVEMLVAHPDSAGHGLNLQHGGNILIYVDHTWRLESYLQILERIGPVRQKQSGYDRPVFVYSIVADDTMDDAVIARNSGKVSAMDALMDSLRRTLTVSAKE